MGEGMDHRAIADRYPRTDHDEGLDRDIVSKGSVGGEIDRLRRDQRDAGIERGQQTNREGGALRFREIRTRGKKPKQD